MKHYTLLFISLLCLVACHDRQKTSNDPTGADTTSVTPQSLPDSTLWGHLGEDTGMSALQFITTNGDTLELYRTDQYTGEDGNLMGEIRNMSDRFAITISPDRESIRTAINASQLEEIWQKAETSPYNEWKLWNGHILLSSVQQQEIGAVNRIDTMDIMVLDQDSLVIRNHVGQIITFKGKK